MVGFSPFSEEKGWFDYLMVVLGFKVSSGNGG